MCMYNERLQILISSEQRKRLEAEAKRRKVSVAALIRDAVDQQLSAVDREVREEAAAGIRAMRGRYLPPEELNRLVEEARAGTAAQ